MCGIACLIGSQKQVVAKSIENMTNSVGHRGPDGVGFFHDDKISLGHRRLSIVDLTEGGAQPMLYEDRFVITFNGEIYNHNEIRKELESLNFTFKSLSDTEVILASFKKWGKDCVQRFNGMWAFVIFDRQRNQIFASRDRFGVKPLYYWKNKNGLFAIASEIKQFSALPGWEAHLNSKRAFDFLKFGILDHTEETMFLDVFQLRGGQELELSIDEIDTLSVADIKKKVKSWYSLPEKNKTYRNEVGEGFIQKFSNSVNLRLRADVPIGSCLSGGLDSSAVVSLMSKIIRDNKSKNCQKTFSALSDVAKFDESQFVKAVVEKTKVESYTVTPKLEDLFKNLEKLVWHQDEPFGSTSIFAQWEVFRIASEQKVKVMLDGQGADEQLMGYHSFFNVYLLDMLKKFQFINVFQELTRSSRLHRQSVLKNFLKMILGLFPAQIRDLIFIHKKRQFSWLNVSRLIDKSKNPFHKFRYQSSVDQMARTQLLHTSVPMLLHWEDRDSMAHGVEARVPFLDYKLVEYLMSLPPEAKLKNGVTKKIMRDALKDILPEEIVRRYDKMGFLTAEEVWMKSEATEKFRDLLKQAVDLSNGIIGPEIIDQFNRMVKGELPFDYMYWRVISFGVWIKVFRVKV